MSAAEDVGPGLALFLDDEALAVRERALAGADWRGAVELAWHLRQRAPGRSARVLREAVVAAAREGIVLRIEPDHADGECAEEEGEGMGAGEGASPRPVLTAADRAWRRRARLVQAEALYLNSHLDRANRICEAVLREAIADHDGIARSDAQLLGALIVQDRGDRLGRTVGLADAGLSARVAGDEVRAVHAKALHAFLESYSGLAATDAQWGEFMAGLDTSPHACLAALSSEFRASIAFDRGRFTEAIDRYREAGARSRFAGMGRRAIVARCCQSLSCAQLERHDEALSGLGDALMAAREMGWARCIGMCLLERAHVLLRQGRLAEAGSSLDGAERALAGIEESLSALSLLQYGSELALARGRLERALEVARRHEQLAQAHANPVHHALALGAQADALSRMGRGDAATAAARSSLALARLQGNARLELDALLLLATVMSRHGEGADRVSPLLEEALEAAGRIEGFIGLPQLRARIDRLPR